MEKLKTGHIILIGLLLFGVGLLVGNKWNTWFPSMGGRQMGPKGKMCCTKGTDGTLGEPCQVVTCPKGGCDDVECPAGME